MEVVCFEAVDSFLSLSECNMISYHFQHFLCLSGPVYMCVCVCTTVQPVSVCEHETDLAAVMINGRNFQYWFHSDQSTRAQKRQSYLLLFSTRFRKGKKTEKSSQFLGLFLIVLHTYIFTAPLTLGNKPVVNSH